MAGCSGLLRESGHCHVITLVSVTGGLRVWDPPLLCDPNSVMVATFCSDPTASGLCLTLELHRKRKNEGVMGVATVLVVAVKEALHVEEMHFQFLPFSLRFNFPQDF